MTGHILSRSSSLIAIRYQIAVMPGIMGSVAFSVLILVEWGAGRSSARRRNWRRWHSMCNPDGEERAPEHAQPAGGANITHKR